VIFVEGVRMTLPPCWTPPDDNETDLETDREPPQPDTPSDPSRRSFLIGSAVATVGADGADIDFRIVG
jgi:hypothetical protein